MRLICFVVNISRKVAYVFSWRLKVSRLSQFWVTKAASQRIPSQRARNSKAPTTETVQSIAIDIMGSY